MGNKNIPIKLRVHSIDFLKVYLIRDKRRAMGISAYEQSFLMGKRDLFVRDVEDPLKKLRYDINDTNYLLLIYNENISAFLPNEVDHDAIDILVTASAADSSNLYCLISASNSQYSIDTPFKDLDTNNGSYKVYIEEKHVALPTALELSNADTVKSYINNLITQGFFDKPKRALDIFNKCKEEFSNSFHPRFMIKALVYYTDKKSGEPNLDRTSKNEFGRTLFINSNKI